MTEEAEVVWPSGRRAQQAQPLAPRLDTIEGKTIGGVCCSRFYFEETWPLVQQLLRAKYSGVNFVPWEEFGPFYGQEEAMLLEALPDKLREFGCDAVIAIRGC